MRIPALLKHGSRIAVTAFSSGVDKAIHPRLDLALDNLRSRGYNVIEGDCLRDEVLHVSASKEKRAAELQRFLLDDSIDAIAPPWGGELAIELLPLLDFEKIKQAKPKWVFGFSDVTTITAPLATLCGWVTVHSANLLDLIAAQTDPLTSKTLDYLELKSGESFTQLSSELFQLNFIPFEQQVDAPLNLTEKTQWKQFNKRNDDPLCFSGHLIGGCLDTLMHLFGTEYLNLQTFQQQFGNEKLILFIENVELSPPDLARVLYSMKFKGVFDQLSGVLIGRNSAPAKDNAGYSDTAAMESALKDLDIPILFDVDIGHRPPNLTLMNGAYATVTFENGRGRVEQTLPR